MVPFATLLIGAVLQRAPAGCDPAAIFARAGAAMGGARWNAVRELVATGTVLDSGLRGTTRYAVETRSGRSALHDDLDLEDTTVVFDGTTVWQRDSSLGVHALDASDARAAARTDAYLARRGYLSPHTDPARFTCLGNRTQGGRTFDVVRVTPNGGRPAVVWIDRASGLIDRTQQQTPTALVTVTYGDYRNVGGLVLPFEIAASDGTPGGTTVGRFAHYDVLATANPADFRRPADPVNQRMLGGTASTTIPFHVENGSVILEAAIDGHAPLPFLLDTGGHAILTTQAARTLGLRGHGSGQSGGGGEGKVALQFTRSRALRMGTAEIDDIPFLIIPYGPSFTDRGPGKAPLSGILGLEVFERFAVRIDYGRGQLTLTPLQTFRYRGGGSAQRIVFQEDLPLTVAAADGSPGLFEVDTGNGGTTVLIGDFLKHHGFFARYHGGVASSSFGTGGIVHDTTFRLRSLELAGYELRNFVVNFVVQQKGTFSSRTEAGNIGFDVLSQFTPTFDYARSTLYLERRAGAPLPAFNRMGIAAGPGRDHSLAVALVIPDSPASEARIAAGDRIVAIDGRPAANFTPFTFRALTRRPAGTPVSLTLERKGATRVVHLRLRELFCNGARSCAPSVRPIGG